MTAHRLTHSIVQALRRTVQASVIVLLIALVFLGLYHHYYASRTVDDIASIEMPPLRAPSTTELVITAESPGTHP